MANEVLATKFIRIHLGSGCPPLESSFLYHFWHFTLYQKIILHKRCNAPNSNYGIISSQSHTLYSLITFHCSYKYLHVFGVSNLSNAVVCEIELKVKFVSCDFVLIRRVWNFEKENTVPETITEACVASCSKRYTRLNFTAINVTRKKIGRKKKYLGYI